MFDESVERRRRPERIAQARGQDGRRAEGIGRCYEMEGTPPFIPWVEQRQVSPLARFEENLLGETCSPLSTSGAM